MKGRCFNCGSSTHVKKECPLKGPSTSGSSTATPNGAGGDGAQPKKVAKVKSGA